MIRPERIKNNRSSKPDHLKTDIGFGLPFRLMRFRLAGDNQAEQSDITCNEQGFV